MSDTYAQRRVRQMSDQELRLFQDAIVQEQALRRRLDASPEKIERAIAEYQKATGKGSGEPWVQPTTALQAYRMGAEVEHEGQRWISTHSGNVHAPGQSGWRLKAEVDPETGEEIPPPYVAPSGSHDSYQENELITWIDGNVYRAVRAGVVHSPDEYAADWQLVEPETPEEPDDPVPGDGEDDEPVEPEEPGDEDVPEFVQPTSAADAYQIGDRILWEGSVYESLLDGNVWSPSAHPQGWSLIS